MYMKTTIKNTLINIKSIPKRYVVVMGEDEEKAISNAPDATMTRS